MFYSVKSVLLLHPYAFYSFCSDRANSCGCEEKSVQRCEKMQFGFMVGVVISLQVFFLSSLSLRGSYKPIDWNGLTHTWEKKLRFFFLSFLLYFPFPSFSLCFTLLHK